MIPSTYSQSRLIRGSAMTRYVEGWNRSQSFLLPESVDDYVGEDNPVQVVDAFVDELHPKQPFQ